MKFIGWDTSTKAGAIVALEIGGPGAAVPGAYRVLGAFTMSVDAAQHSERLLWGVHQTLESCRWKLADVDAFGVGVGPGSFTGLRIGLTTAKTLAWVRKKPIYPVSSLLAISRTTAEVLAISSRNALVTSVGGATIPAEPLVIPAEPLVIAAQDAAKGELFALWGRASAHLGCVARPEADYPGRWDDSVEERVITPDALGERLRELTADGTPWLVLGEGRNRYPDLWKSLPAAGERKLASPTAHEPNGASLAALFAESVAFGLERRPVDVVPRYLRESDAERKLKAGTLGKRE